MKEPMCSRLKQEGCGGLTRFNVGLMNFRVCDVFLHTFQLLLSFNWSDMMIRSCKVQYLTGFFLQKCVKESLNSRKQRGDFRADADRYLHSPLIIRSSSYMPLCFLTQLKEEETTRASSLRLMQNWSQKGGGKKWNNDEIYMWRKQSASQPASHLALSRSQSVSARHCHNLPAIKLAALPHRVPEESALGL